MNSLQCRELDRIDGEPQGFTTLQFLAEIQNMMTETQCVPEQITEVVSWAWKRKEMVRNSYVQIEWKMGFESLRT